MYMMSPKQLGWVQIIGAVLALIFAREVFTTWAGVPLAVGILALVFLITGCHHLMEKKHK
jgi:hypothetical protein